MKKQKTVNRDVRVLEARELFEVAGGRGCTRRPGPPPGAVGLPMFPPLINGLPVFPPAKK